MADESADERVCARCAVGSPVVNIGTANRYAQDAPELGADEMVPRSWEAPHVAAIRVRT